MSIEQQNSAINQLTEQLVIYATTQLKIMKKSKQEVNKELIEKGLPADVASMVVNKVSSKLDENRKENATKDMVFGGLWMVGGILATVANFGYIFWGAILYGLIQFGRGFVNIAD